MCEEGEGGDLDLKQAALCYRAAVARGHAHAHFNLGHLLARGRGVRRDPDAARAHFEQAAALGYTLAHQFLSPT
jgi:TPR repeat protein